MLALIVSNSMDDLKTRTLNGVKYCNIRELHTLNSPIIGKDRNPDEIMKKLQIPEECYARVLFGKFNTLYVPDEDDTRVRKLFVKVSYIKNLLRIDDIDDDADEDECDDEDEDECNDDDDVEQGNKACVEPDDGEEDYPEAPEIINLPRKARFKIGHGSYADIQVRGNKQAWDSCIYSLESITTAFKISKALQRIKTDAFIQDEDYLIRKVTTKKRRGTVSENKYFLTFQGVLALLFSCRKNKRAVFFVKWASKTLFTVMMGTYAERVNLSSKLTGISIQKVEDAIKKSRTKLNALYLFELGEFGALAEHFEADEKRNTLPQFRNSSKLLKVGKSSNLSVRLQKHRNDYSEIEGASLEVHKYGNVNRYLTDKAETELIKEMHKLGILVNEDLHNEIFAVRKRDLGKVIDVFCKVVDKYSADPEDMEKTIYDLRASRVELQHENEKLVLKMEALKNTVKDVKKKHSKLKQAHVEEMDKLKQSHRKHVQDLKDEIKQTREKYDQSIAEMKKDFEKQLAAKDKKLAAKDKKLAAKDKEHEDALELQQLRHEKVLRMKDDMIAELKRKLSSKR